MILAIFNPVFCVVRRFALVYWETRCVAACLPVVNWVRGTLPLRINALGCHRWTARRPSDVNHDWQAAEIYCVSRTSEIAGEGGAGPAVIWCGDCDVTDRDGKPERCQRTARVAYEVTSWCLVCGRRAANSVTCSATNEADMLTSDD